MKKILLILLILVVSTGCKDIKKESYKNLIDSSIKENYNNKIYNTYHNGYKYYLPKYMSIKDGLDYNEKLNSDYFTYYLYVDVISYYNNIKVEYEENKDAFISYKFKYKDKNGYIEINEINNDYLVEIIYNYAKIEVKVDELNLNETIYNSITILSTIKYDKEIIDNLIGENKINSKEESLKIFEEKKDNDDFLEIIEEYDTYEEKESDIPDYEVIN